MLLTLLLMAASPADGWQPITIQKVAADAGGSPIYLQVQAGDLDGDGLNDDAILRLTCAGGAVTDSRYQVTSPRDLATGQASGKRMHKPLTITKEWEAASAKLAGIRPTYDIKTLKGARIAPDLDGWSPITLGATEGVCAAATTRATKTRSNIQNNRSATQSD